MGLFDDLDVGAPQQFGTPEKLEAEGPGLFNQFLNFGSGALFGALDFLDLSGRAVRKTLGGDFGGAAFDYLRSGTPLFLPGLDLGFLGIKDTGHFTGGQLLEKAGLHEGTENVIAGLSSRDILGFGVEILLDPLTYVGGAFGKGLGAAAKHSGIGARDFLEGIAGATRQSQSAEMGRRLAEVLERGSSNINLVTGGAGAALGFASAEPGEGIEGAFLYGLGGLVAGHGIKNLPRVADYALSTGDLLSDQFRRTRKLLGGAGDAERLGDIFGKAQAGIDLTRADAALLRQANEDLLREVIRDNASNWISMRTGEQIRTVEEASRELSHLAEQLFVREAALLSDPAAVAARGVDPSDLGLAGGSIPIDEFGGSMAVGRQVDMFGEPVEGVVFRPTGELPSAGRPGSPEVPRIYEEPTFVTGVQQEIVETGRGRTEGIVQGGAGQAAREAVRGTGDKARQLDIFGNPVREDVFGAAAERAAQREQAFVREDILPGDPLVFDQPGRPAVPGSPERVVPGLQGEIIDTATGRVTQVGVGGEFQAFRPAIPEKPATPFIPGKDFVQQATKQFDALPQPVRKALQNYFLGIDTNKFLPGKIVADAHQVQRSILDKLYIDEFITRNGLDQLPHVINADSAQTLAQGLYSHLNEIPEIAAKKTIQEKLEKARQIARAAGADKGIKARKLVGSIDELNKQFPGLLEDDFLKLGTIDANRYAIRVAADDIITHVANDLEWSRHIDEVDAATENFWVAVPDQILPASMKDKFADRLIRADIWEELFDSRHGVATKMFAKDTPGKLVELYRKFTSYWSQWTLGPFAGWWARNLVGNFWNSWLAGGISNNPIKAAQQFRDAGVLQDAIAAVVNGTTPMPTKIPASLQKVLKASGQTLEEFAMEAVQNRVISNGFMTSTAGHQHLRYLSGKEFGLSKSAAIGATAGGTAGLMAGMADPEVSAFESSLTGALAGGAGGAFVGSAAGIGRRNWKRLGAKEGAIETMKQMIARDPQQSMWVRAGFGLNGVLEDYFRINHYLVKKAGGATTADAMRDVAKSLGNFSDLSAGDEAIKQLLPFWSWTRFNVPRQFRAFAESGGTVDMGKLFKGDLGQLKKAGPHKVALVGKVKVNLDEKHRADVPDEILPEWLQGQLAVPVRRSKDGRLELYSLNRWLPIADLTEIDSPLKMMQYLTNSMNPLPSELLTQATGRDTFFGAPLERYPGEMEHFFGIPLSKRSVHILRNARVLSEIDRTWGPVFGWTPASERLKTELDEITKTQAIFRAGTGLKPRPVNLRTQRKRRIQTVRRLIRQMQKDRKAAEAEGRTNAARHLAARIQGERDTLAFLRAFDFTRNPHFRALELDE